MKFSKGSNIFEMCINCSSEPASPAHILECLGLTKQDLADDSLLVRFPVLLQGETSSGKTSLIQYLAKVTGNVCLRVNNHEHTDIQEYIGTYGADDCGNLVFREGSIFTVKKNTMNCIEYATESVESVGHALISSKINYRSRALPEKGENEV
ncbi:midasin [Trichonephila clavipes]|nr:midasin [Trichonephila clavipes]